MNFIALKMLTGDGAKYFGLVFAIAFCTFLLENQTSIFAGILKRTGDQFQWDCIRYYLKNTGIPVNFGITIAIALIVGTVVAGQTFYLFNVENLKQFGTLKAIGVTNCRLTGMVLLQALTVGLIGFGLGTGMAAEFFDFFGHHNLATRGIILMWQSVALTAGCIFLVVIIASLLSIRRVVVLEPAAVFRG